MPVLRRDELTQQILLIYGKLGVRLLDRYASIQTANGSARNKRCLRIQFIGSAENCHELHGQIEFRIYSRPDTLKIRRSYACHSHNGIGDLDLRTDDLKIAAETIHPETIAQQNRPTVRWASADVIGGVNEPADVGLQSKNLKSV